MNKLKVEVAKDDLDFVGIKVQKNKTNIIFPVGYNIEEFELYWDKKWNDDGKIEELRKNVISLMKAIERTTFDYYDEGNIKFAFSSAMFIIENYLKYGLYIDKKPNFKINGNGRVNWKQTINKIDPTFYNKSFFYDKIYTVSKKSDENKITKIHLYCLSVSLKVLNWMYNINEGISSNKPFNEDEMIYELTQELYKVNEDSKKQILKEMILFLKGTSGEIEIQEEFAIGRDKFDKVWEDILRRKTYSLYKEFECKPITFYHINKTNEDEPNRHLLPDIVVKKDNKIIILDAKYYREGYLPQSSDICKQLFYGRYITDNYKEYIKDNEEYTIHNIFILPKKLTDNEFENYGYASTEGIEEKDNIDVYYLDTKSVINDGQIVKSLLDTI